MVFQGGCFIGAWDGMSPILGSHWRWRRVDQENQSKWLEEFNDDLLGCIESTQQIPTAIFVFLNVN